ncbi:DMSO/TMAO reductase YedYZ molybdopterin-dependent catalytic subunit [Thermosporothrix hazakensis]|uniref:DMSO/TMAO reductase YedYZ molybdopterin-dependent catalytic subunit n=2 Tax=Thermosporothrix TaxID=768650 RepID=A0A326UD71_THEHA|nr:sulfite oxidase-like oxidoreductase [Thermosporothrix hazakensis]PZW36542.1 DMSO/TMAO reductase YedYZ molybdopterin-dependent catalytic subunit [Thermosporothrix hazakensis]BBH89009.1 sulfite oxidase-like oxidoreductase [Thermosporothrix sp. COM3]GCE47193.1 sulfite oxidase-like oxidoreductase [Thermosporothrix hazakensis]
MKWFLGKKSTPIEKRPDGRDRLPPGQHLTRKWPVLTFESTPSSLPSDWRFRVSGLVENPLELTWEEFLQLPHTTVTADFHCVTLWSRYNNTWEGIHIREILQRVRPLPEAQYVMAHCWTGYTTNIPLTALDDDDVLIALKHDGKPLTPEHGGPVRLIVPKLYGYKSAKWLDGFEFMEHDKPGFWETRGYHNSGDPWKEERYW